jgi:hypothetical protein
MIEKEYKITISDVAIEITQDGEVVYAVTCGTLPKPGRVGKWLSDEMQRSYDEIVNATQTRG